MHMRLLLLLVPILATMACSDQTLGRLCLDDESAFDVDAVSVLQDAQGYTNMRDAIVLEYDPGELGPDDAWRVKTVQILAMIPASQFDSFPERYQVIVEVWDAESPAGAEPYQVVRELTKADVQWTDVHLDSPAVATELDQKQGWWEFNFTDVIPESGMNSTTFVAGVHWGTSGLPTLGYSNFNLACDKNWTDYDDGRGWILNSEGNLDPLQPIDSCSWPMMRVEVENRLVRDEC